MSENVSSTPAIPPGRAWSSNERERVPRNPRPHHRWGQSRPTFAAERTQNQSASSAQWDTFEEVMDPGDMEMNLRCWLPAWTMVKTMLRFQVWTISQLEKACLKLAELPEALAIVQAARRGASDSMLLQAARANLDNHSADNVYPTVHVISDRAMTDQLRSSEELNDLGHSLHNAEARICKQSWGMNRAQRCDGHKRHQSEGGLGCIIMRTTCGHFGTSVCRPCFRSDAGVPGLSCQARENSAEWLTATEYEDEPLSIGRWRFWQLFSRFPAKQSFTLVQD